MSEKDEISKLSVFLIGAYVGAWGMLIFIMLNDEPSITTPTPLTPSVTITITDGQADTLYTYREK